MMHNIHFALPAENFTNTAENLKILKDETDLHFIWDPLNDAHQARHLTDDTVKLSMSTWDKSALYGSWDVVYPGMPLTLDSLRESEIYLERRHQGRDLRRTACEAFLLNHGWRSEVFLYLDRSRDFIRTTFLSASQYHVLCDRLLGGYLALHRRLIWFPSLAAYAAQMDIESTRLIRAKEELCRKEATTRQLILDDELIERLTCANGIYRGNLPGVKKL